MAPPAKRAKYETKDLATKVEILKALKDGVPRQEVMKKYDVKRSTLATYVKNEAQIIAAMEGEKFHGKRKRLRTAAYPQLEDAVLRWIVNSRDAQLPLSGPLICTQAENFAAKMGIEAFKASEGWFSRFKERHGLIFRNICGERAAVDEDVVRDWRCVRLREHIAAYEPCDVFNADETALFFKALPDKTITLKGDPCVGGKRSKERVTVLLAANMTGTERLPLLVIGKAQKPRCFKNLKQLPVEYCANQKAWMTSDIWRSWLQKLDRHFRAKERKVLLVVDNCSAHCNVSDLEWVKVVFFPPNTTSALQPMDQGIIHYVKRRYRRHVLERMLLCMGTGRQYDVTLLSAVHILAHVWTSTPAEIVANCFRHCGFVQYMHQDCDQLEDVTSHENEEDDDHFRGVLPPAVQIADYISIDDGVAVAGQLTDEDIVNEVLGADDNAASDEDCEEELPRRRTVTEAAEALAVLEDFCCSAPGGAEAVQHLAVIRKVVLNAQISCTRQTTLSQFFS